MAQAVEFEIIKIVDGDTIKVHAPWKNEYPEIGTLLIRLYGLDTPEKGKRAKCQEEADLSVDASNFTRFQVESAKQIDFKIEGWDKYGGRVLAKVYLDGVDLSEQLIKYGYARPYHGEKKSTWCPTK